MKNNILVIRFSSFGDVAITIPVIKQFLEQHPDKHILFLSRPAFQPLFEGMERVEFVGFDIDKKYKGLGGIYRMAAYLKKHFMFTEVADLHQVTRTKILMPLLKNHGIKWATIDKGRAEKKALTRKKNKVLKPLTPTSERYADVFRGLGYTLELSHERKEYVPMAVSERVDGILDPEKINIGMAPFARYAAKTYPQGKMEILLKELCDHAGFRIFLFGKGEVEEKEMQAWVKKYPCCTYTKDLSLHEELYLMNRLSLMVTMDSANMHLASLAGTRVISIWGGTHPYAGFLGYGQQMKDVIQKSHPIRPTSVYGNTTDEQEHVDAYWDIDPAEIVQRILHALKK